MTKLEVGKNADHRRVLGTCILKFMVITRMVFLLGGINFDGYMLRNICK